MYFTLNDIHDTPDEQYIQSHIITFPTEFGESTKMIIYLDVRQTIAKRKIVM